MVIHRRGYSLIELLVVSAIMAVVFSLGGTLMSKVNTLFKQSLGKIETQRDVRNVMTALTMEIRKAKASTVSLSRVDNNQSPYTKISFTNVDGIAVSIYQSNRTLIIQKNGVASTWAQNLRSIYFVFPSSENVNLLRVLMTVEKTDGTGRSQSIQMGAETIRLLNE